MVHNGVKNFVQLLGEKNINYFYFLMVIIVGNGYRDVFKIQDEVVCFTFTIIPKGKAWINQLPPTLVKQ